jgi:hypothetical protein
MAETYRPPTDGSPQSRPVLAYPELNQALLNANGKISAKAIGNKLMRFRGTIVDGFRFELAVADAKTANKYKLVWCGRARSPSGRRSCPAARNPSKGRGSLGV